MPNKTHSIAGIVSLRADGRAIAVNGANILAARLQVLGAEGEIVVEPGWSAGLVTFCIAVYYAVKGKGVAE